MPSCRSMVATLILEMRLPRFRCCAAGYIPGGGSGSTRASSTSTRVGPGPASRPRRVPAGPAAGQGAARRRRRHRPQMAHTPVAVAGNRRVWSEVHAVEVALVRLSGPAVLAARVPGILAEAELVLGQAIHEWLRRGRPRSPRHRTGPAPN